VTIHKTDFDANVRYSNSNYESSHSGWLSSADELEPITDIIYYIHHVQQINFPTRLRSDCYK